MSRILRLPPGSMPESWVRELYMRLKETIADILNLARILRILAAYHIFTEIAPDIFAHNRISSALDTGKSVEEILAK